MVKRAVGTKACLLGKAVTCKYLRQDNFLEVIVSLLSDCSLVPSIFGSQKMLFGRILLSHILNDCQNYIWVYLAGFSKEDFL